MDDFITDKVKLLKLEAEGAEPEILMGAENKLELIQYIAADLGFERGKKEESTYKQVTNFLLSRGFILVNEIHETFSENHQKTSKR